MQRLIASWRRRSALDARGRIPALDGLRAFFVFSVVAYHFWQQSWLAPAFTFLGRLISLDPWLRTGYLWVDGLLLLSGFLLYLPTARAMEAGRQVTGYAGFYTRRFFRIVPTYVLHLLVIFLVVALPEKRYATWWEALRDWLAHLSFSHPWFAFSSLNTPLNGALWTLGVEVQFYLLFPLVARAFRRMPLMTYLGLGAAAFLFRHYALHFGDTRMLLNQLPAFLDVYLNGFVAAMVYARLERRGHDDGLQRVFMTGVLLAGAIGLAMLVGRQAGMHTMEELHRGQLGMRYMQSLFTALVLLGACLGLGGVRILLGNRLTFWLAAISYQVYMWHQMIALQMKKWGFPPSVNPEPHMAGERTWQLGYTLTALALTLLIATAVTYLIERPLSERARKKT